VIFLSLSLRLRGEGGERSEAGEGPVQRFPKMPFARIEPAVLALHPQAGRGTSAPAACFVALALFAIALPAHAAGNVTTGRQKALQCQTCHGLDGLSKLPEAPNLGGQPEPYLVKSLNDFRRGIRKNDMMTLVVQQLSDQDVADLAAFYAAIEVTTKPPK
jgi:cytochrome c553